MGNGPGGHGSVALVGAGPGDPGLITVRGLALLRSADVVIHDRLVGRALLAQTRRDAEVIDVGKRAGQAGAQSAINRLVIARARSGRTVVRLKGGDPFVFARGGEEAAACARAGISFEVVPGVSASLAAPAAAGIPPTLRGVASTVMIATGHERWLPERAAAVAGADTVIVLMAVERLADITRAIADAGRPPDTPAVLVSDATLPTQHTVSGTLSTIAGVAARAEMQAPAVLIVGAVVRQRALLGGWDTRPLSGVRVLVTRASEQAADLSALLAHEGAHVVEAPAIRISPGSPTSIARAIRSCAERRYDWIIFTSANGVRAFNNGLERAGSDTRIFAGMRVAAVGPGTGAALRSVGISADLVAPIHTTAALGRAFPPGVGRVLLARAAGVDHTLDEALRRKGWTPVRVALYRVTPRTIPARTRVMIARGEIDIVTFASAGTIRAFRRSFPDALPRGTKVVCIGPVSARAARAAGLRVSRIAVPHTIPGLVDAVRRTVSPRGKTGR